MSKRQDERLLLEHIPYAHFRNSMQHAYLNNGDRFTHFQPNGLPNMPFAEHPSIVLLQQKFKQLEQNKKSRGGNQLHRIPLVHNGSQQLLLTDALSAHQNYQKNRPVRTSGTEPQQALVLRSHLVSKEGFFQGNTAVTAGINSSSATISPGYKHVSAHTGASNNVKLDDSNLYLTSGINSGFLPPQTAPKPLSDTCAYSYEQSGPSLSLRIAQPSESQITIELALGGEESYHLSGPAQGHWSTNYASNNRQEAIDLEPDTTLRL
ncbi:hypothetical protein O6H91_05G096100 [Diphasiastrum complanatum]|uniref:Uncharacterized protein n=1 Tax=Diphasiastrum complanatum TaxID=34168 RepID=A0ACC2DR57_DIPCM|nr:hypothetical protein O6H91_05G096100 [Diphasiastrum complanatum]